MTKERTTAYNTENTRRWRHNVKRRVVEALGGKCCICGYSKCRAAIEFHHLDPSEKEVALSKMIAHPSGWSKIVEEMSKCVALCSNCHREVHAGVAQVPDLAQRFDEKLIIERDSNKELYDNCPTCGGRKVKHQKFCSRKCIARGVRVVDWNNVDLAALMHEHKTYSAAGRVLGVTGAAVKRREQWLAKQKI